MPYNRKRDPAPLFMGSGDLSMARCYDLINRLHEAFAAMAGCQQPEHWDHEPNKFEVSEMKQREEQAEHFVSETALDIFAALTGLRVTAVTPINRVYSRGIFIRGLWEEPDDRDGYTRPKNWRDADERE